jgi:hypothetical protein
MNFVKNVRGVSAASVADPIRKNPKLFYTDSDPTIRGDEKNVRKC